MSANLMLVTASIRWPRLRACITLRSQLDNPWVSPICTWLIASTPPTMASGACADSIPDASNTPTIDVEHAITVEKAGVAASSLASICTSRAILLQRMPGITVPQIIRSGLAKFDIAFATGTDI